MEKYFSEVDFAPTRHHIDSYEKCMFDEIPTIIHSTNPMVFMKSPLNEEGTVFAYRVELFIGGEAATPDQLALTFSPPVVTLDQGNTIRRMLPNEARIRNLTYSTQVNADIQVRVTFTEPNPDVPGTFKTRVESAPVIKGFPLFRMPILLRSRLCPTGVADPARLEEMGECRNDYGGYFIIGGAEKVLITRGEQAFNSLYVEKKPNTDDKITAYASVVSLNPETKQTRRVALSMMRGGEIRVSVPMIRAAFPLFILFRAMGIETDEEIVRMIFPDVNDPISMQLQEVLVDSIQDAYPIFNRYTAIKYIKTLTKGSSEQHVLDILNNLMLPHVPNEPMARAQYLAEMAREMIRAHAGLRGKTDRDDMRNHRFMPTGTLVRELFNGCWKDWRAAVILSVDKTYRANEQAYQGSAVFDLFAEGNLTALLQPHVLNTAIMRGYRGKWGTNEFNTKSGVLQPLARISYLDATSHTRRVVSDFDTGMKTTGPRKLNTSQIGYFCTSETPQGAHIGVTKNMSMMTQFSFSVPVKPVYDWMRLKGGLIPVAETTAAIRASATVVQVNGGTVGFTLTPRELERVLKLMKWNACLSPTASIAFNTTEKVLRISLDEGRPIRPLWHLNKEGSAFLDRLPELKETRWRDLVFGTLPATADATLRSTRFLDPLADNPAATFADYEELLKTTAGFIEYCDPVEMNENYIAWWGGEDLTTDHTHSEIHPSSMTGVLGSMVPYSNHNQAPRNQLSCSQSKQGIGYMSTNIQNRYDTYSHMLCYGESPISRTFMFETLGNGEMPYGTNAIIAATSESGYNQDDGLIINKDSVARGMFRSLAFRSYDCAEEVDSRTKVHSHIANPAAVPAWSNLKPGWDYSKLDDRGIIREGEYVDDSTVLIGRYMVIPDTHEIKDSSVTPGLYTQGRVDSVVVLHQGDGHLLVKVRIIEMRVPVLGDKFSSRHGQKGTIGMFVAAEDMPRTADGIVPDVMVNPGGFISRMTVAQLVEMVAGRAGAEVAAKFNATTFCNGGDFVQQLGDILQAVGAQRGGDNVLYSGITGKQIRTDIYMCPLYFMRIKHLTEDKVNARGAGRREIRTHQPTGGRGNEGGLRIGEMERDSLCAHGVSCFLQESMMKRGDATEFWICNGCGRIPIYNEQEKLFVCPTCDGPLTFSGVTPETLTMQLPTKQSRATFSKIAMPYTMKLLDQELTSLNNTGFRFATAGSISRLRDADWNWPSFDVEFKAEGALKEGSTIAPVAEEEAEEAAAGGLEKVKQKEGAVAGIADQVAGEEGAMAVMSAAAPTPAGPAPVKFHPKLTNGFIGLTTFATAPMRLDGEQFPAPDGTAYPVFGADPAQQTWPTVEHYYQAMKFPQDPDWQESIRSASTPARAKKMGLDRAHPVRGDWEQIKERVMKKALMAKFRQNPGLLSLLQTTGDRPLMDVSPGDLYWGAGTRGNGKNRLGALLGEVRTEMKDVRPDTTLLQTGPATIAESAGDDEELVNGPANYVAEAQEMMAAATGGVVQMMGAGEQMMGTGEPPAEGEVVPAVEEAPADAAAAAAPLPKQTGGGGVGGSGIYMFINPQVGGDRQVNRRSRARRHIQWAGMPVEQDGGGPGLEDQSEIGGGPAASGPTEVMVEKLQ